MAASYDQHFDKINSSVGVSVMADRSGGGIYNTYNVGGVYAYQLYLSDDILLKAGAQVNYMNQSISTDKLIFRDMIDPTSGATTGTTLEDPFAKTSIHRADFNLGVVAYGKSFYLGGAVKHITRPNTSFTNIDDSEKPPECTYRRPCGLCLVYWQSRQSPCRFGCRQILFKSQLAFC